MTMLLLMLAALVLVLVLGAIVYGVLSLRRVFAHGDAVVVRLNQAAARIEASATTITERKSTLQEQLDEIRVGGRR